jgi:proton-translocating NADH-quinone oxidoreductase chain L
MLLSILFPLLGSLFSILFGKFIGHSGSVILTITLIALTFLNACYTFYQIAFFNSQFYFVLGSWIESGQFFCNWGFQFDALTGVMLLVVTSISLCVHIYSSEYMSHDPHLPRFMGYISLFTFFMLMLVTADNLIQMFLGWEGVGFCSYLLINFWFTRIQANKAAIKAMLVNRVSDFFLVLGILTIFYSFKTVEYSSLFATIPFFTDYYFNFFNCTVRIVDLASFFLFLGCMGKSAQLFLHTWLPDAMEGPTPVSALIHAATMVTAGVFLLARCSPLFEVSPTILQFVVLIGASTAFFAGTIGLVQNDLKKVIAYSTCSQLGYMMMACGVSNYSVAIFHLAMHAFFKALLFLSAGSVIHALGDEQDMRRMGGLRRILPFTYSMFVIGSLSLAGFPFLTGFYSKDAILEVCFASHTTVGHFAYWLGTLAAFCTAFYSVRLLYLTFLAKTNAYRAIIKDAHDAPVRMALPLVFLAFASIFFGYAFKDLFIGAGTGFWQNSIYVSPFNSNLIDAEFLPVTFKLLPTICSLFGMISAYIIYHGFIQEAFICKTSTLGIQIYTFLNKKWYFDKIYHETINQNVLVYSFNITYKLIDRGIIELFGPYGIRYQLGKTSKYLQKTQTGYIFDYILVFLGSVLLLFLVVFFSFH